MDWGQFILTEGDYLLRVVVAALCGLAIGSEREARLKRRAYAPTPLSLWRRR